MYYSVVVRFICTYQKEHSSPEESNAWAERVIDMAVYDKLFALLRQIAADSFDLQHALWQMPTLKPGTSSVFLIPIFFEAEFQVKARTEESAKQEIMNQLCLRQGELDQVFTKPIEIRFQGAKRAESWT